MSGTPYADAMAARLSAVPVSGRHDAGARRKSKRAGRERGCWVYIAAEQLAEAGIDLSGPPPLYRAWAGRRANGKPKPTLLVQLYEAS